MKKCAEEEKYMESLPREEQKGKRRKKLGTKKQKEFYAKSFMKRSGSVFFGR